MTDQPKPKPRKPHKHETYAQAEARAKAKAPPGQQVFVGIQACCLLRDPSFQVEEPS